MPKRKVSRQRMHARTSKHISKDTTAFETTTTQNVSVENCKQAEDKDDKAILEAGKQDDDTKLEATLESSSNMDVQPSSELQSHNDNSSISVKDDTAVDTSSDSANDTTPKPHFKVGQHVYVRDADGLIYESIIRRTLYGRNYNKQVQIGIVSTISEADEIIQQMEVRQEWHYFVHYQMWNVKWDRWVAESDVFIMTDFVKEYKDKLASAHKLLRQTIASKGSSKKRNIDGHSFLTEWMKVKTKLDDEMGIVGLEPNGCLSGKANSKTRSSAESRTKRTTTKSGYWNEQTATKEQKLRSQGLTSNNTTASIILPMPLKKILVDEWEIICQCQSLANIPARVSVYDAIRSYVISKGVSQELVDARFAREKVTAIVKDEKNGTTNNDNVPIDDEMKQDENKVKTEHDESSHRTVPISTTVEGNAESPAESSEDNNAISTDRNKEWLDFADGMCMLFDEALPTRLLYEAEQSQRKSLDANEELAKKRYCELYSCEHMLRLLVRLPALMAAHEDDDSKRTSGIINDFVRYMNKNQGQLFVQTYRKPNESEQREQTKMDVKAERKRKLATAS